MKIRYDVSQFQNFVKARSVYHYYSLPEQSRAFLSIEDCTQDALLYVHEVLNRFGNRKVKYNKDKAKLTTHVYMILESYFDKLRKRYYTKKRLTNLVAIEGLENVLSCTDNTTDTIRINQAVDKIVRFHLETPPHLLLFIAQNIYHPKSSRFTVTPTPNDVKYEKNVYTKTFRKKKLCKEEIISSRCKEFRQLANKYGITREDYRLALSAELR